MIRLERNYRSKGHILAAASGLIAHNKGRLGKTLFTDDALGLPVVVSGVWDDEEEARTIGEDIEALQKAGTHLNDMAILVRASFQMRAFEDRFVTLGLPYRVIGGPRFYERQEIKDAIAYLEVTLNPANDLEVRAHRQRAQARAGRYRGAASKRAGPGALDLPLPGRPRDRGDGRADRHARASRSPSSSPPSSAGAHRSTA